MPIPLKDIPHGKLTPDEIEAISNDTFDYADREQVSLREANRKMEEQAKNDSIRRHLIRVGEWDAAQRVPDNEATYNLEEGYGDFTLKEKVFEIAKAAHRGLGSVVKLPGVAMKAYGELPLTRREIAELKKSSNPIQRFRANFQESSIAKYPREFAEVIRKAGNKYIDVVNGMMTPESRESQGVRNSQSFMSAPFYRTAMAVGESAPSYGVAIAATVTSANPNIGLFVLGSTTASSSYENYREMGVDPDLALIGATLEGTIEVLTEKVPMDMLMKGAGRPFLLRALKQGTAESFQELFAQLGQNYVNAVVQDVDPENYATVLSSAKQEWSIISQGWEDAMAAGFAMGGGAAMVVSPQDTGLPPAEELSAKYGFTPRNTSELLSLMDDIKGKVKAVEKEAKEAEKTDVGETKTELKDMTFGKGLGTGDTSPVMDTETKVDDGQKPATISPVKENEASRDNIAPQTKAEAGKGAKLTESQFYDKYSQHKDIRGKQSGTAKDNIITMKSEGFRADAASFGNTIPAYQGGKPGNVVEQRYAPKKGDIVYLVPNSQINQKTGNIKKGWKPNDHEVVEVEYDNQPLYELYEKSFNQPAPKDGRQKASKEIGEGEIKPRGSSVSVMAQAIEDELVSDHDLDDIPTYKAMNMKEQAEKALALIESDIELAKRVAFYKEISPDPTLYPENVFSALRVYAKMNLDIDLLMDLALNENVVREHTIMGKRIKSLDTDQDSADPIRAIREVVKARTEQAVRQGQDLSSLEAKLRELQAELEATKKANTAFKRRAEKSYGVNNKLVTRTEYDSIIARRKKEASQLQHTGRSMGAMYVPTISDFADIAKIATFHLEAMGRDFNKWSYQMTKDFGEWITPYLQDEYDKALEEAEKAGIEIKESKRLTAKKKRLATSTNKLNKKFKEQDLDEVPRIPIELDEEGQRLQHEYDMAKEKYKAAQAIANIITEEEVRIIAQLAKDVAERKAVMEKSRRRDNSKNESATQEEWEYGIAMTLFLEYTNNLKAQANQRTMNEVLKNYLANPVDFVSDAAGTFKAAKASLDNSFHLRQGLPTFLKAITGDIPSMKIWWKTFMKSWKIMWNTLRKRKAMQLLSAEMLSDPDYELLKKSKVALHVIEEEIPVDLPSRIPIVGMLFRMGENAFVGSSRYMRYQLAKQYINVWRKSGIELNKKELESIGRLANSQTGRGESSAAGQKPGLLNNLFWSPRNLRAYVDILTVHAFDRNFSSFARKQAAINLLRYISGAAIILSIAKWLDDDSVTWDSNSADFGKIKVGSTRFAVGGGMSVLVVLASRLVSRKYTSSTTGKTKSIDLKKWGALSGKDLIWNFVENKLSPAASLALTLVNQKTRENGNLTIPQMTNDALTPLIIQNVFETGSDEDAANVLAALMAEALGVNVQTYGNKKGQKRKRRKSI